MKIIIPDKLELTAAAIRKLNNFGEVLIYDDVNNTPSEIIKRIKEADVITANYIDITEEIIGNSPRLKYIVSPAVGFDWIDVTAATAHGVKVINCPTFNTYAVAEHVIALIFSVFRRIVEAQLAILNGKWVPKELIGREVRNKKILTIGHGNIGSSVCQLATGLGMQAIFADSKTTETDLADKIKEADIVVLCYPLTAATKGSFDAHKIALMKSEAIIINVGRGLLLDQQALFQALKDKKISGAGLDVFYNDSTITVPTAEIMDFAKLPNVVTTPHIGYNTLETRTRLGEELVRNLEGIVSGHLINNIN